jgi:hypothetical protein
MVATPDLPPITAHIAWRVVAAVIEAHAVIARRRVLRWIWFPGQLALITWVLVSLGPADWDDLAFRVGFAVLIACYATWLFSWAVRLPGLYRRDFVLPRLERGRRKNTGEK